MLRIFLICVSLLHPAAVQARGSEPPEKTIQPPPSWTAEQMDQWQAAAERYRKAVDRYGVNSEQAVKARHRLDRLSDALGHKRPHYPNTPAPGKSSTPAKPDKPSGAAVN